MASTFSNLKFEIIGDGEQSGTWGTTTNTNIGTAIEQAIVGMATLEAADFTANVATLTLANTNAAQDARALCLNIASDAVSAAGTINVPAIQKPYIVINGTSFAVTVKVSGQTGVAVPPGKRTVVYNNGTDVGDQISFLSSLTLLTALPTASGGTGLTSFTANGVAYASSTSALATGSALTFDGTNLGIGLVPDADAKVQVNGSVRALSGSPAAFNFNNGFTFSGSKDAGMFSPSNGIVGFATSGSERMRIDSSGNVGIGTSSPTFTLGSGVRIDRTGDTASLELSRTDGTAGSFLIAAASGSNTIRSYGVKPLTFLTDGSELARIDASGNLLVGTTSADARFVVSRANDGVSGRVAHSASTGLTSDIFQVTALNHASGTGYFLARFYTSGPSAQFAVRGDGTVYAQNTTIQSISDARVKENVRDSSDGLATITALRPVRFDFKEGHGNNRKNQLGFIAQEVEAVFPDAVDTAGEKDESGDPYKSVGPGALIPVLVKAIQELKAEFDAYKATHP